MAWGQPLPQVFVGRIRRGRYTPTIPKTSSGHPTGAARVDTFAASLPTVPSQHHPERDGTANPAHDGYLATEGYHRLGLGASPNRVDHYVYP